MADRLIGPARRFSAIPGSIFCCRSFWLPHSSAPASSFHQIFLVEAKGWALESWAATYVAFAAASVVAGLAFGVLADRVGAPATLPWLLPPLALACLLLTISNDPLVAWGYMILAGVSMGAGNIFFGAFWPHVYGTAHLGSIRSLAFALTVLASALSPALMGAALDLGVSIETITLVCAAYCAVASVAAPLAMRLYSRSL